MLRIVYMGTPDFAVLPLKYLVENNYEVVAVVTNLDKPIGRKQILTPPPVKSFALERNIPVFQYGKIRAEGHTESMPVCQTTLFLSYLQAHRTLSSK